MQSFVDPVLERAHLLRRRALLPMKAPKMTLLSPGGRNALGTSTNSPIVPARQTTQITAEIHRCLRNHQSDPP